MYAFKRGRFMMIVLASLVLGAFLVGCATNARVKALEADTQKALEQSGQALQAAQGGAAVEQAVASARRAEDAASRAEDAALRAEKAAERCEEIYNQIMSK